MSNSANNNHHNVYILPRQQHQQQKAIAGAGGYPTRAATAANGRNVQIGPTRLIGGRPFELEASMLGRSGRPFSDNMSIVAAADEEPIASFRQLQPAMLPVADNINLLSSAAADKKFYDQKQQRGRTPKISPISIPSAAAFGFPTATNLQQQRISSSVAFKLPSEPSEEDEFDVEEVYHLLEEHSGQRLQMLQQQQENSIGPRRRERLTNLTAEEKLNRRKHKNRIAAQAARDRKKETSKRLEESLKKALLEIGRLRGELKMLRAENARLHRDNLSMRYGRRGGAIQQQKNRIEQPNGIIDQQQPLAQLQYVQIRAPAPTTMPLFEVDQQHHFQHQQNNYNSSHAPAINVISSRPTTTMEDDNFDHYQQQQLNGDQLDSLGSAVSFNEPLPWERESDCLNSSNWGMNLSPIPSSAVIGSRPTTILLDIMDKWAQKAKTTTVKSGAAATRKATKARRERELRMTCAIKVLLALWTVACQSPKALNSSKFSMNSLKTLRCQSTWTASAVKSLKKELMRRMLRMDGAKLDHLSNSPQSMMVNCLLMHRSANRKARGRQRSSSMTAGTVRTTTNSGVYSPITKATILSEEEHAVVPHLNRH